MAKKTKKPEVPAQPAAPKEPPVVIVKEQVLELARRQWSVVAIAAFFKCDRTTIYRNVPAAEIDDARHTGVARLREALYTRAMGGRIEVKRPDGTVEVQYLKSSDRLLQAALDRFDGKPVQPVEINPDPQRPANVNANVDVSVVKAAVASLEEEF
jgi:hypothetical protein